MVSEYDVIFHTITPEMRLEARPLASRLAELNHHQPIAEDTPLGAAMSQIDMAKYLGAVHVDVPDYDMTLGKGTIDNKNITTTVGRVLPHYDAQVFSYNPDQKCEFYTFSRVRKLVPQEELVGIFLIGWISKADFQTLRHHYNEGEVRNDNTHYKYTCKGGTDVVLVQVLHPLIELKRTLINTEGQG
jgi:hypothetical protein